MEKLYLNDSLLLDFEATVLKRAAWRDQPSIILDRSAFYGEAGGQLGDRGVISFKDTKYSVLDCQYDDAGELHHILEAPCDVSIEGQRIKGSIDEAHRRDMMSQHTGQHMLSCAFHQLLDAATVSSRLGAGVSTIDIDRDKLDARRLEEVEIFVNQVILEDRPIRAIYPNQADLERLDLRKLPKVARDIRVIEIEGFDLTPCGGTHCERTGQVGPLRVINQERYKGMTRVSFLAGKRAIDNYRAEDQLLRDLARELGCAIDDVPEKVFAMRDTLKEAKHTLKATRTQMMGNMAADLHRTHPPQENGTPIIIARDGLDVDTLRTLSRKLAERADVIALTASRENREDMWRVVIDCGESAQFDAGAWFKQISKVHGGRGGGNAGHAEGTLPSDADWAAIAKEAG